MASTYLQESTSKARTGGLLSFRTLHQVRLAWTGLNPHEGGIEIGFKLQTLKIDNQINAFRLPNSSNSGGLITGDLGVRRQNEIRATKCAKCGKEIPVGQDVKKGFLMKKSYHMECAS